MENQVTAENLTSGSCQVSTETMVCLSFLMTETHHLTAQQSLNQIRLCCCLSHHLVMIRHCTWADRSQRLVVLLQNVQIRKWAHLIWNLLLGNQPQLPVMATTVGYVLWTPLHWWQKLSSLFIHHFQCFFYFSVLFLLLFVCIFVCIFCFVCIRIFYICFRIFGCSFLSI